jgi:DNA-binding MarR family transcriptional regulator
MTSSSVIEGPAQDSETEGNPPFVSDYLAYLLAHASHLVSGQFHEHLRKLGIQVPTWRVLAILSDGDGMTIGEVARIGLFNQPTATKIVERLCEDELVERRQDAADRRKTLVFITAKGRELVQDLLEDAKSHEKRVTASYSDEEVKLLKDVLRTLISRLA